MKAILGKKAEMATFFDKDGNASAGTRIICHSIVSQIRDLKKDKYEAVQISFQKKGEKDYRREIRGGIDGFTVGQEIKIGEIFREQDRVAVSGISKGKGFAGVVKRWHFKGGPRTHGQSDRERAPGSIGSTTTPGRVYKGKRMAGKIGQRKTTTKGLVVLKVDPEKNEIIVKGAVPGVKGSILIVKKEE